MAPARLMRAHDGGVGGGCGIGGVDLRAGERHHPVDIEQILHGVGHAGERRQRFALGAQAIDRGGFALRPLEGFRGEAIQAGILVR